MCLDDTATDRQSQPGATGLRGGEWRKEFAKHVMRNTRPIITHAYFDTVIGTVRSTDHDLAIWRGARFKGLYGVAHQIEQHQLDLNPIDLRQRQMGNQIERDTYIIQVCVN